MESKKIYFNTITINELQKLDFSDPEIIIQFGFVNIPTKNSYLDYVNTEINPNIGLAKLLFESTLRIKAICDSITFQQKILDEFTLDISPIPILMYYDFHKLYMNDCAEILNSHVHSGFLLHIGFDEFFSMEMIYADIDDVLFGINKLLFISMGIQRILDVFFEKYYAWSM